MKKLELNLDELEVDSFLTEPAGNRDGTVFAHVTMYAECGSNTDDAACWAGTYGGYTCDTTCHQILCGCSAFMTDCDATCPGYWNAEQMSCNNTCRDC